MEKAISLNQIGLYNPQRQSGEVAEKLFVVRQKQFELLMERLNKETPNSIPQHHLIIAQRGMGKTTMLKRIEVELHKKQYRQVFIPLLFPEEQYNLRDLTEFWLNCLDALADSLETEKYDAKEIEKIDAHIKELMQSEITEKTDEKLYRYLLFICKQLKRRPILLIDNIGLVFNRLNKDEQHILRSCISENACPVMIGAGVSVAGNSDIKENVIDYKAPFYDFFQIQYLKKLNSKEFMELIRNLATVTQTDVLITPKEMPRLQTLFQLTGGNPRTAVMLFKLLVKGFSEDIIDDVEALLDEITPLYKSRFEELSAQQQIILDAIAMNWDAINLKKISETTRYANNQLSPQLKRLTENGWIETTRAYKAKGNAYSISERFFSIWLLMRRGSRRQKKAITYLSKFLECFYRDETEKTFNALDASTIPKDVYCLEQTLSELYKRNEGIATQHLSEALNVIENAFPQDTQSDWEYFAAITVKLGYGQWLLDILEEKGYDIILSPYFVAIQTFEIGKTKSQEIAEIYLKNQAVEKSEPARIIIEKMKQK
ncbi:MAG: ATP-binding protein [Prevotellaceae bacterium]|jgi:DNA-binding MarR family transcriptional regulator|nr:ATP-binding protein [Prevotellaceae bacterium]